MKKEPGSPILIFALAFTALCSGVCLSLIYAGTLPMIRKNQAAAIERAIFKILPGTSSFEIYEVKNDEMVHFQSDDGSMPEGEAIYRGFDENGGVTGFAVPSKGPGFQDDIKLIYGFKPEEDLIVGMQVLESRETPGLGDKIEKKASFTDCFLELKVVPEVVANKKGTRTDLNQVDTISGATISSVAVIRIINQSVNRTQPLIETFRAQSKPVADTKGETP